MFWYFAIGSMMHPMSMKHRNVVSLKSVAGQIQDHRIHFFSNLGFAEAIPAIGGTFHGVLHRVEEATMTQLDKMEIGYTRSRARARRYDTNEIIDCHVYTRNPNQDRGPHVDKPPMQRYIEIMIAGAEHFELDAQYIEYLKNHPYQPRPRPSEFKSIGDVPYGAPTISLDQLDAMNAPILEVTGALPLFFTINGKVLKCIADREAPDFSKRVVFPTAMPVWDICFSRIAYDMKYGAPGKLEDFTHEHSEYVENLIAIAIAGPTPFLGSPEDWEIYCHLDRPWKD
jgi:gamma-glutamylcyclotransferase (GGCT)/AIG2-like uncharacterized protein YtfP